MKRVYNEGRVLGLSSYELYVRELLATNPGAIPLSEREWLASTVSANNSMILKIAAGTTAGYHDYILPENSDLCSCTVLNASIFEGNVATDDDDLWAIEVGDYGPLIKNEYGVGNHPVSPGEPEDIPVNGDVRQHTIKFLQQCKEYAKIVSGLMFQPGDWIENITYTPILNEEGDRIFTQDYRTLLANIPFAGVAGAMALVPDLSKRGFIRIAFSKDIEHDFFILFNGFTMKTVMKGVDGFKSSFVSTEPWNGDFLGPQIYPWATKIVFLVDLDAYSAGLQEIYNAIDERLDEDAMSIFDGSNDFNNYNISGFYHIDAVDLYYHSPRNTNATAGQLTVNASGGCIAQTFVGENNKFALRFKNGDTWSEWRIL